MADEACPAKWRNYVSQLAQQDLSIYPKELQEVAGYIFCYLYRVMCVTLSLHLILVEEYL